MILNDVTLREGEQMPDRNYTVEQKVEAGLELSELGVESLEVGFPVTGEKDREAIRTLAVEAEADIVGLARAVPGDVEAAADASADVIQVMVPTSDYQLDHVLDKDRESVLQMAREAVDLVVDHGAVPHLILVDAFRTEVEEIRTVAHEFDGVECITLADTVGARLPSGVQRLLEKLEPSVDLERFGVHFHDDLGVGTANVLTAYQAGIGKADVSVASLGERAGNSSLEEVVVGGVLEHDEDFGVETDELIPKCERVLDVLGEQDAISDRKAILGSEVTKHESGIHTAAMLNEPKTFEPFDPGDFGGERDLLFGEGTGTTGASILLSRAGVTPTDERVESFLSVLADEGPVDTEEAVSIAEANFQA
ncbi:LeuA family protein [Natronobacterium texcoconense]|uniref:4-hydroxy-2-oxovalerate aldolase n=1 Tax=Natronobacterium texcoconense TaxID=1095778 RepID=A0A1H1H1R6_NATTX|nr:LeuA family protein [Natronobacterium texcoconense]SDR19303.1 4-hydroxy-2-oxovalerate aldolase [Natronobacterium texcoconense]